jgi:hypothetical protein
MRKSIKAALFSTLLFPGAGHFSLKRYKRGLVFFVPAILCIIYLISYVFNEASIIAEQMANGNLPPDPEAIAKLVTNPPGETQFKIQAVTWIFIACWIISIVDSFQLGYTADQKDMK